MIRASTQFILPSGRTVKTLGLIEGSKTDWECQYTDRYGGNVTLTVMFLLGHGTRL